MTFGFAHLLGIDIQQVSIATLIIALGLLVDDPVVARRLHQTIARRASPAGHRIMAWADETCRTPSFLPRSLTSSPISLSCLLTGTTGEFLYSLPVVMTCALVASRLVSMTFIPFLGYYLLRPAKKKERTMEERRTRGFSGFYYRVGQIAIEHRWKAFAVSLLFLGVGGLRAPAQDTIFPR